MATSETIITGKAGYGWCVYTLECRYRRVINRGYEDWKYAAMKADRRVYVGSTNDMERRMAEHLEGRWDGSKFTQWFKPERILALHFCKTEEEARSKEEQIAQELQEMYPGWFVWQN